MHWRQRGGDWWKFERIDVRGAAGRIAGVVRRTPLIDFDAGDERVLLKLKPENRQETGAFKARGAWNQISLLTDAQREAGVVATSSGNHAGALAWAAQRAGVPCTVVMPQNSYPNKIEACRSRGAEVVLMPTREAAEEECERLVAQGRVLVHPYDAERTIEGAGTVGLEIAEDWPDVEVVVIPVGGGGLLAGSSLALRRELGERVTVFAAEPAGAPSMAEGLAAGKTVFLDEITTQVQGLCPLNSGVHNIDVCLETVDGVDLLPDELIFEAQRRLVLAGEVVEPAGAAAPALVFAGRLPSDLLEGRDARDPLRVCCVLSGGNPDPAQLEALRATA